MLLINPMKDTLTEVVHLLDHSLIDIHFNCKILISQ
jgi:hypothetical protein